MKVHNVIFMNLLVVLLVPVLRIGSPEVWAQTKIGFTEPEVLMLYMPEAKTMQKTLETYRSKLQEKAKAKERDFQAQVADYQAKYSVLSAERKAQTEKELQDLQSSIEASLADMDKDLAEKQNEMLQPIVSKLNEAIAQVAKDKGLGIVLTRQAILFVDESAAIDISRDVASALGIAVPEEE